MFLSPLLCLLLRIRGLRYLGFGGFIGHVSLMLGALQAAGDEVASHCSDPDLVLYNPGDTFFSGPLENLLFSGCDFPSYAHVNLRDNVNAPNCRLPSFALGSFCKAIAWTSFLFPRMLWPTPFLCS